MAAASSVSVNNLLSYVGWTFLPNLVTGWLQALYYGITIRAGDPKPQPNTPRYVKHRRRIHITVVLLYLAYSIYEADYYVRQAGDFYQLLGVPLDADERAIKSRFRRLAALHHPDKVQSVLGAEKDNGAIDSYFVSLKTAQDTLTNPVKRYAYDRFGPDFLQWQQQSSSIQDYFWAGLPAASGFYIGSYILMIVLGTMGYVNWGRYWRYLTFSALCIFEYYVLSRTYAPPILTSFANPLLTKFTTHPPILQFQLLILARKTVFTLFIALSQLSPFFAPPASPSATSNGSIDPQQLIRLEQMAKGSDFEAARLLTLEMTPFANDEGVAKELRGRVKDWLVTNTIRADPEVRDAVGKVMGRRRTGAPPGAKQ